MSDKEKKLNVFQKKDGKMSQEEFEKQKIEVTRNIFDTSMESNDGNYDAIRAMKERTEKQMLDIKEKGFTVEEDKKIVDKNVSTVKQRTNETQINARDEQIRKNQNLIDEFNRKTKEATERHLQDLANSNQEFERSNEEKTSYRDTAKPKETSDVMFTDEEDKEVVVDKHIETLSQPDYNASFDVIPLPSKGKSYRNRKQNIRVAYMTTADENILTSPNLLNSGQFLEILFNRKILEPSLRYKDLLPGDRNAIMIWLRATSYGEMYPITLFDEAEIPFETEINLNELKTKYSSVEPDENGHYDFKLPLMGSELKLRLLTCGDVDDITYKVDEELKNGYPVNNLSLYRLEKMIVSVDGNRNKNIIKAFVKTIRIGDSAKLNSFIETLESDIDLDIVVETPGGGSVATFLPLNLNFFWPNARI